MGLSTSDIAVQEINNYINLLIMAKGMRRSFTETLTENAAGGGSYLANLMVALNTCAQNADGSLGAADASPVAAHPIDPRVYPALTRAVSSVALTGGGVILNNIITVLAGGAVAADPTIPGKLNALTAGA
jgi:hypothetical protein